MQGLTRRVLVGVGLASLGLAAGCAEDESMLFVEGVMVASAPECIYRPDGAATLMTNGVYDVGFGNSYVAGLLVGNQLASRGDEARSRTETSRITLNGAEVQLRGLSGRREVSLGGAFSSPGTGFIDPSAGGEPGYGVVSVMIIPQPGLVDSQVGGYVIAQIRVFGETLGGQEIESNDYRFPISVCRGCLVSFENVDASGACVASSDATGGKALDEPCHWGQDEKVNCALCAGSHPEICATPVVQTN